jgi:hypothetical protein
VGTTIKGANGEESFPVSATVENILSVHFFSFTFVSFRTPLLHKQRVADTFLSDVEMHLCHFNRLLLLLAFAGGNISLRTKVIHETTACCSRDISPT